MRPATLREWSTIIEGNRRGMIGPLEHRKLIHGTDEERQYWDGDTIVASMYFVNSISDTVGSEVERIVKVDPAYLAQCRVYIPTDEENFLWEEEDYPEDSDEGIARRERDLFHTHRS